ncbi:MAG: UTRA domain-containing protein [Anaerolineales bacterium]|nr:UTRA domain-containing protein [Anaerolineales bacterium]
MVDKSSFEPLYAQIQKTLEARIRSGELTPGDQIPSEKDLAAKYDVSRMTARKAIERMVAKGLLFRQQGKGTFVAEEMVSYGFSTMLSFSRTLKSRGYSVKTKVLRRDVILCPLEVQERLNLNPGSEVVIIRRLRYVAGEPVAIHTSYLDHRFYAQVLKADLSQVSLLKFIEEECGVNIVFSRDTIQAIEVSPEDSLLLECPEGCPILELKGVAYDERGEPARFTHSVYRGDRFRLSLNYSDSQASTLTIADGMEAA